MKKFFIVLGSIFFALIVLAAIGIAFVAVKGTALDKESKAYVDSAIPAIVSTWSEKELLDRASPEFKKAVTIDQLDRLFRWVSALGPPCTCCLIQYHFAGIGCLLPRSDPPQVYGSEMSKIERLHVN